MLFPALKCFFVDLLISTSGNHDNPHHRFCVFQAINHPDTYIAVFDLKQARKISIILVPQRFSISTIMNRNRILRYFQNPLNDLCLNASIQPLQVLFRLFKKLNAPTHSITTSSVSVSSSSVIPSSFITSSIGVVGALLSLSLFVASIKRK